MTTFKKLFSVNAVLAGALVIGLINNVAITAIFGLNRQIDSYFASLTLIMLIMSLIVDYLGKNFLPSFAIRRNESYESASILASLVINQVAIFISILTLVLVFLSEGVFSLILPGFEPGEIAIVSKTFSIMAPAVIFQVISVFHEYMWQHDEQFTRVVFAKTLVPATLTVFIIGVSPFIGVIALPLGFLTGHFICMLLLTVGAPYKYRIAFGFQDEELRKIIKNSATLMTTGFIARSTSIITQYFASLLGEGAISAISIARKICTPVSRRAQVGVRMMVFSRSAKASAKSNLARFARLYNLATVGVLLFAIPIAVWYAIEADLIVRAVFQRGEFTDAMAQLVVAALIGFSGSVVFSGIVQMLSNGFYALDRIMVPVVVMPLSTIMFFVLAFFLVPQFEVLGLTLSLSITSMLLGLSLMALLHRFIPEFAISEVVLAIFKYLVFSLIAVLLAKELRLLIGLERIIGMVFSGLSVATLFLFLNFVTKDKMLFVILEKAGMSRFLPKNVES